MPAPPTGPPPSAEFLAANKGPQFLAIIIIFPALALITVILRLYTRFRIVNSPSYDDFAVLLAMIFSIGCSVCQGVQVANGMGRHVQAITYPQVIASLKSLYASIIFYNFGLSLTKVSILLQYLRIAIDKPIRRLCWICFWFTIIYCIETFFAGIFQCYPVEKFWDAMIPGKCVNTAALYYANAGINIAQDISLIVLPFFILRKLILPKREKISLMLILGLGGFATIASVCRLHALYLVDISTDITWDNPGTAIWSSMELNIGIICASLPTLRAFFTKYWPKAFLSSLGLSRQTHDESNHTGHGQYYNMEGNIMVKKTIDIRGAKDVERGEDSKPSFTSSQPDEQQIRGSTPESQCGLSALPRF